VVALAAAAKALEDTPETLGETTPESTEGLNLDTLNRLVAEARLLGGLLAERVLEKDEFGEVSDRGLRFLHPNGRDEQVVWTWGRYGYRSSPGPKVPTVVAILRAWREERLTQIATPPEDRFTLDVLGG
jgi:hypothetical protein